MGTLQNARIVIRKNSTGDRDGDSILTTQPTPLRRIRIEGNSIPLHTLEKAPKDGAIVFPGLYRSLEDLIKRTGHDVSKNTREAGIGFPDVKGQNRYTLRFNRCDIDVVQNGKLVNSAGSITISISKWVKRSSTQLLMQIFPDDTLRWHPLSGSGDARPITGEDFDRRGADAIEVTDAGRGLWRRLIHRWSQE